MSEPQPALISEADTVLCRQVPSALLDEACGIMSTAFTPSPRDAGRLSTLHAVDPYEAHRRYTEELELESAGTWGIEVGLASSLHLPAYEDSCLPGMPADHASVVFTAHTKGQQAQRARKLRDAALSQGPLFTP
ncbi:hypothetical protein ATL42_1530 [Sanguibacter antarcticus]|uniref:Uncharacterized protein n=1 Tax=Sanguibacter antarcticus TaxID=372484 RepID=A0A2A9E3N7_9MICO|nr:hypothetical protein ATL42_1530 [Sanguibacter antarcticus]